MNAAVRGEVAAARGMTTLSAEIGAGAETTTRVTATAAKGLTAKWPQPARPRAVVLTPPRAEAEAAKATAAAEDNDGDEGGLDKESESDSLSIRRFRSQPRLSPAALRLALPRPQQ